MKRSPRSHKGMALIAVLWLTAAMGLIISGIVREVRSEARSIGLQRDMLQGSTQADAALLLALQKIQAEPTLLTPGIQQISVNFNGQAQRVDMTPLNGLVDINRASLKLLTSLYQHAGQLPPQSAAALAQATIDSRQMKNARGRAWEFESSEDLMRVPGMTYRTYAKIKKLVTAELQSGSGLVNPLAAPLANLELLLDGDLARASVFLAQRQANLPAPDSSFFNPAMILMEPSQSFNLQTEITLINGGVLHKDLHVQWTTDARSGLPWRLLGSQQYLRAAAVAAPAS